MKKIFTLLALSLVMLSCDELPTETDTKTEKPTVEVGTDSIPPMDTLPPMDTVDMEIIMDTIHIEVEH